MKLRMIALAGVAASALAAASPAMASEGWYLGLGGGIAQQNGVSVVSTRNAAIGGKVESETGGLALISLGYKFDNMFRLEVESGYAWRDVEPVGGFNGGYSQTKSTLVNAIWDIPLGEALSFSIGGGIGVGNAYLRATTVTAGKTYDFVCSSDVNFAYQGIAGLTWHVAPDLDLFLDYRYRTVLNDNFAQSAYTAFSPMSVGNFTEHAGIIGLRWFMTPPPPPPTLPRHPFPPFTIPRHHP